MIRTSLIAAAAVLALAGCNQPAPGATAPGQVPGAPGQMPGVAATRAPAHPSQSPATASGPTRQLDITAENRAMVENNIRDLINQSSAQYAQGGTPIAGFTETITAIQPGTDHQIPVTLTAGTQYAFVGVCDADCNNVDLELLDGVTGAVVGSDLLDDDYPVIHYTAAAAGPYFVRAILRTCTQAPCFIGVRGLQAPTGGKGQGQL